MSNNKKDATPIIYIDDMIDFLQEIPVSHVFDALRYAWGVYSPRTKHLLYSANIKPKI